ncbi:DinB family protein [Hymenobacter aerilatus]|uniref:DinB family protein n=1 Tax=Hymenobacter aerilatus TaxID=2932251 RepID=A0A8T9T2Q1_9BACT|nr:DinB family protein [Hymenobacter aerilatus]UOR07454.1 DinB family protein [Hymenobacter aerilatus]
MNYRLSTRLEQLERATERLLQSAEALGERAYQSPGSGKWSAAQVVQHLLVSETGINQYLEKKIQEAEGLQHAGLGHFLRSRLLRVLLRAPFLRFQTPAYLTAKTPITAPPLPELRQQWASVRRRLEQILNEYPEQLMRRAIFKHPRSGMLTIAQTLDFMVDHVLHHQKQIERIEKMVKL